MRARIPTIALGAVVAAGAVAGVIKRRSKRKQRQRVGEEHDTASVVAARHDAKISRIVAQLAAHDRTKPLSLRKNSPPHQVPKNGDLRRNDEKIDIGDLTEILSIDPVNRTCTAEAGVTFVDLVEATLAHGLVPAVVPELKTITIGGAVSGCSIESMSFVVGGFHDTCLAYEVVTSTGEVLTATPENQHSLVFHMLHGAFGTLGILTKLTFKLVPAKAYVHLVYETHATFAAYRTAIEAHAEARDCDFMDGIIHSPTKYVLSVGHFVDDAPYTSNYDWLKVYYVSTGERREDYMTTANYFFRYDRGVTNVRPRSFLGRLVFGKFISSTSVLAIAEKIHFLLDRERPTVTLDVFVPMSRVEEFLTWYEKELGYFPLWAVPYRRVHDYPWLNDAFYTGMDDQMFLDLAIYGMKQPPGKNAHKMIEDKLRELGGMKTLISHNYYTPEEFWQTWNQGNYQTVKQQTDPDNLFRDIYTKTCRAAMGVA